MVFWIKFFFPSINCFFCFSIDLFSFFNQPTRFSFHSWYANLIALDHSHELFLRPSDHLSCSLSSKPPVGSNYDQWRHSCEVSPVSKHKLGFVIGYCAKPALGPLISQWE